MLDPRPGAPVVSNPPISDVHQRWQADRDAIAAPDPWQHSPDKTVMVKQPDGTVVFRPRTGADGAPDQAAPGNQQQPPQPLNSDGKIQLTPDIALSETELRDLLAFKSTEDSRRLTAPTRAEDFKLELPADLKMPEGVTFQINPNDAAIEPARAFALRNNLSQQQFSEMLGLYAASQATEMVAFNAAKAAELAKLGDTAQPRISAIQTWLRSMSPDHFAGLANILQVAPTAATVRGLESLMHRWATQGSGSFSGAHREPSLPGRVSQETYDSYNYAQKLDYASKFPQDRR
jgi:hypothetical protein